MTGLLRAGAETRRCARNGGGTALAQRGDPRHVGFSPGPLDSGGTRS